MRDRRFDRKPDRDQRRDRPAGGHRQRPAPPRRFGRSGGGEHGAAVILFGWHAVKAALENPQRRITRLMATENALRRLREENVALAIEPELVRPEAIANRLGPDAVHQGLLAEAEALEGPDVSELPAEGLVLAF